MIHLDTSFLIRALVPSSEEDSLLRGWISDGRALGISAVAWTVFLCGPLGGDEISMASRLFEEIASFRDEDSRMAAELFNAGGRRRGSMVDCMIAASAIGRGAMLATSNIGDFRRLVPLGLRLAGG